MKTRTAARETRLGIYWLIAALIVLASMLALWWLVEDTNEEGTHDAELLLFFALIPFAIAMYHLLRSRMRRVS